MSTSSTPDRAAAGLSSDRCLSKAKYDRQPVGHGYCDRYLLIDLSSRSLEVRQVPLEMKRDFIGGRGYCLKLVYDGTTAATRHDSPENVLAIAGGPLCGDARFPGTGKCIAGTISPLTGTFCDSNAGGVFFSLVKLSGFDAIAVTGKSDSEVIVYIDGDRAEVSILECDVEDEGALTAAEAWIERFADNGKRQNVAAVTTGVGCRNSVWGIINSVYYDRPRKRVRAKQFGRGGTGTVMTGKGLRAIVVKSNAAKSNGPACPEGVKKAGAGLKAVIKEVDPHHMNMREVGTPGLVEMLNDHHLLPICNFQYGQKPDAAKVYGEKFGQGFFRQDVPDGCFYGCNLACTKGGDNFTLTTGPHAGMTVGVDGPEYETIAAATNVGIFDVDYTIEYNWYCDQYGLDTIGLGNGMGFAFEAYERGYLTAEDTGGMALKWGDKDVALALVHQVARGEGFGQVLGQGVAALVPWIAERHAARNGQSQSDTVAELAKFAMVCKGMEFSFYSTKESLAQQGGYGYALKGPQHDEAWLIALDQIHNEIPTFEQKAEALRWFPLVRTWFNIVGLCKLPWIDVRNPAAADTPEPAKNLPSLQLIVDYYNACMGTDKTLEDVLMESERVYTFHKLFNLRHGRGARDADRIPLRCLGPVFENEYEDRAEHYDQYLRDAVGIDPEGMAVADKLQHLQQYRRQQYEHMTDAVYEEKGYDSNSVPTLGTLARLGLDSPDLLAIVEQSARA